MFGVLECPGMAAPYLCLTSVYVGIINLHTIPQKDIAELRAVPASNTKTKKTATMIG